jgi:hypothetical protein
MQKNNENYSLTRPLVAIDSLCVLNIIILWVTAFIRPKYLLLHFIESLLFIFTVIFGNFILKLVSTGNKSQNSYVMVYTNFIISFASIWAASVVVINRIPAEFTRQEYFYALLLLLFFVSMIGLICIGIYILQSFVTIKRSLISPVLVTWIVTVLYFYGSALLFLPPDELTQIFSELFGH